MNASRTTEQQGLIDGARALGVALSSQQAEKLLLLLDELAKWNRTHNLTAITDRGEMITHHLLDSLSVGPLLEGMTVADVGTGAGFPGLPLAVVNPERAFTLIDSNNKKVRFVAHAARTLGLANVSAVHARAELGVPAGAARVSRVAPGEAGVPAASSISSVPEGAGDASSRYTFDIVLARAFAALPELLEKVAPLCGPSTRVVAMKGKRPDSEIAAVPASWRVIETRPLAVPGLNAERHVVILRRAHS